MVKDSLDIAVGEGDVQISEDEFLGGIAAIAWMVNFTIVFCRCARLSRVEIR